MGCSRQMRLIATDSCTGVVCRCEERAQVLDSVVSRLGELQTGVRQVDTWIGATLNALKHDRDPHSLKNRVEGLFSVFRLLGHVASVAWMLQTQ